jgi:glycerol-3-phosphate dehydrogenase
VVLVYEALAERQRLRRNAPHLVRVLPFLIPILTRDGLMNAKIARALGTAMWGYDLTGGLRIGKRHQRLTAAEALTHLPTMPAGRLPSAYLYYDARADDARLCLAGPHRRRPRGRRWPTTPPSPAWPRRTTAVTAPRAGRRRHHRCAGRRRRQRRRCGPTMSRALDEGTHRSRSGRPRASTSRCRGARCATTSPSIPVPKDRAACSWCRGALTYVGTTDTDHDRPIDDPQCTPEDIAYVLRALNHSVTTGVTDADIVGTWAGLRPLVRQAGGRTADLSRRHRITTSAGRVVTVTGGKLTTYRRMAADTVDDVMKLLDRTGRSGTARLRLAGAEGYHEPADGAGQAAHLAGRYGGEAPAVEAVLDEDPALARPLVAGLPYLAAEAVFAARHEMATTVDDVLSRRTYWLLAWARRWGGTVAVAGRRAGLGRRRCGARPAGRRRGANERRRAGPALDAMPGRSGRSLGGRRLAGRQRLVPPCAMPAARSESTRRRLRRPAAPGPLALHCPGR